MVRRTGGLAREGGATRLRGFSVARPVSSFFLNANLRPQETQRCARPDPLRALHAAEPLPAARPFSAIPSSCAPSCVCPRPRPALARLLSRLTLHLVRLGGLGRGGRALGLGDERLVDVRDHAAARDRGLDQRVELLVAAAAGKGAEKRGGEAQGGMRTGQRLAAPFVSSPLALHRAAAARARTRPLAQPATCSAMTATEAARRPA